MGDFIYHYVFKAMFLVFPLGKPDAPPAEAQPLKNDPISSDTPMVVTLQAVHRNATEQEPWFLAVAIMYALTSPVKSPVAMGLCYAYALFRWVHWLCYLCHVQPFRSFFFVFGLVSTLVMSIL